MIPFISIPSLPLFGSLALQPFGVLAAIGIVFGYRRARLHAVRAGVPREEFESAVRWLLLPAFFIAHVFEIAVYHPDAFWEHGIFAFFQGQGLSSFGGFLGAVAGLGIFTKGYRTPSARKLLDAFAQGIAVGWIFGRLGCTTAHDHPGAYTDFFLGVRYPDGAKHDLGFYEFLFTLFMIYPVSRLLRRKKLAPGSHAAILPMVYAPVRFCLDFLRAPPDSGGDIRYFALTPAQYGCILIFVFCWIFLRRIKSGETRRSSRG